MGSEWNRWGLKLVLQSCSFILCFVAIATPHWIEVGGRTEGLLPEYDVTNSSSSDTKVVMELTATFLYLSLGAAFFLLLVYLSALIYRAAKYKKTNMFPYCLDHLPSIACFFILVSCSIYTSHARTLLINTNFKFGFSCILAWSAFGVGLFGVVLEKVAKRAYEFHALKDGAIIKCSLFFLHTISLVLNITSVSSPSWIVTQNSTVGLFLNCTKELNCSTELSVKERLTLAFALMGILIQGFTWLMWSQQKIIIRLLMYTSIPTCILCLFACVIYTTLALELPGAEKDFIFGIGFVLFWSAFGFYAIVTIFLHFLQTGSESMRLLRALLCDDVILLILMVLPGWVFQTNQYVGLFSDPSGKEHATATLLILSLFLRIIGYVVFVVNESTIKMLKKFLLVTAGFKLTACIIFTAMTLNSSSFGFGERFAYSFIISWIINIIDTILVIALFTLKKGKAYMKNYWMSVLFASCFIFMSCSLATNNWMSGKNELIGLFYVCNTTRCIQLNTDWTSYERCTAIFLILAVLTHAGSCFTMCSFIFYCKPNRLWLTTLGFYLSTLASLFSLIACSVYTSRSPSNASYGSSFASAWIGFGLSFISSLVVWTITTRARRVIKVDELPDMDFRAKYLISALKERTNQETFENFSVSRSTYDRMKQSGVLGSLIVKQGRLFVHYKNTDNALPKVVNALEELISVEKVDVVDGFEDLVRNKNWLKYCLHLKSTTKSQVYFEKSDNHHTTVIYVTISSNPKRDFEKVLTKWDKKIIIRKEVSSPLPITKYLQTSDAVKLTNVEICVKGINSAFVTGQVPEISKALEFVQGISAKYPLIRNFHETKPGSSHLLADGLSEAEEIAKKHNSLVTFTATENIDDIFVIICSRNQQTIDEMWQEITELIPGVYEVIPPCQCEDAAPTNIQPSCETVFEEQSETRPKLPVGFDMKNMDKGTSSFDDGQFDVHEPTTPLLKGGHSGSDASRNSQVVRNVATSSMELNDRNEETNLPSKTFYDQTSFDKRRKNSK